MRLELAQHSDAEVLRDIQKDAFENEYILFSIDLKECPPGYNSATWQLESMDTPCTYYYKIITDSGEIIGGLIIRALFGAGVIERIFIKPNYQGKGIGRSVLGSLNILHSEVTNWKLETPEWSTKNNELYKSFGFVCIDINKPDNVSFRRCIYEKII